MLTTSNTYLEENLEPLNPQEDKANLNIFSIEPNQQ